MENQAALEMAACCNGGDSWKDDLGATSDESNCLFVWRLATDPFFVKIRHVYRTVEIICPMIVRAVVMRMRNYDGPQATEVFDLEARLRA